MKSLITSVPWSPILRSSPPVAFLLLLLARRCRQQRAFAGDGAGDIGAGACQRLHGLGLGAARSGHDQQPQRIAGQALGCRGGNRGGGGVEVVFRAEPFFENRVNLGQAFPRRRICCAPCAAGSAELVVVIVVIVVV